MTDTSGSFDEERARAALRERLGGGARVDAPGAPATELAWARRGTAYFARKLNDLADEALDGACLSAGRSRRLLVAQVGYQARALARVAEAAREGRTHESLGDPDQLPDDVHLAATLPAHALRFLFEHTQVHLNVEWRDLSDADWDRRVLTLDGRVVAPREAARERAISIWFCAVELGNGGTKRDFPPDLRATLDAQSMPCR